MMKHKGLFLASLLLLTACDEPGGKRAFMRECTAQGDTALCDCAWEKLVQRYGQDWGNTPGFLPRLILLLTPVRLLLNAWRNEKVLFPPDNAILYKNLRTTL